MADDKQGKCPVLTTADGAPIGRQHALTAGPRGPLLMQDVALLEQMQHFNRERIPERVVHAKGSGAYGTFTVTHDITRYTKAAMFSAVGKQTELFLRFSTVAGERGAADAERDVRGFAVKFYTEQGNWDMVGNNTPVFFIRDPLKFQHFIRSQKRRADNGLRDHDMQWDFWTLSPESAHQVTWLMGDRGIPKTWRNMNGYSSHTYLWVNAQGEQSLIAKQHLDVRKEAAAQGNVARFEIPISQTSGQADLRVSVTYQFCRDGVGGLCKIRTAHWSLPLELKPGAQQQAVKLQVKPPQ